MKTIDKKHAERVAWAAHLVKTHPNPFLESKLDPMMFQLKDADIYSVTKVEKRKHNFWKTHEEWQKSRFEDWQVSSTLWGQHRKNRYMKLLYRIKNAIIYMDYYTAEKAVRILINHFSTKRNYKVKCLA
jgi:hypothetical protein